MAMYRLDFMSNTNGIAAAGQLIFNPSPQHGPTFVSWNTARDYAIGFNRWYKNSPHGNRAVFKCGEDRIHGGFTIVGNQLSYISGSDFLNRGFNLTLNYAAAGGGSGMWSLHFVQNSQHPLDDGTYTWTLLQQ